MSDTNSRTRWHLLLGKLLECLLPLAGIQVQVEPKLMNDSPRGDIILLRRQQTHWTDAQKALLADGIRDSTATHILLEFKYTESINDDALKQTLGYEYFYRNAQKLKPDNLACFLLSSKTPQATTLARYSYAETHQAGVYRSNQAILNPIILISLNDLADTDYNAWLRCFASKQAEKQKAFQHLQKVEFGEDQIELYRFTQGLLKLMLGSIPIGELSMKFEVTPEDIVKFGEFLEGTRFEKGIIKRKLKELTPQERLEGLKPEERLEGLEPEERLKGLPPEVIEAYLQKIKHHNTH